MNPTLRLVLFGTLGGLLAVIDADAVLPMVGAAVGVLIALRMRDGARLRSLDARLRALEHADQLRAMSQGARLDTPPEAARLGGDLEVPEERVPGGGVAGRPVAGRPVAGRPVAGARDRPAPRPAVPLLERLPPEVRRVWDFATGGNLVVRVGLLVLFVGLGLGIRYAVDVGWLSVTLRLVGAGVVGLSMVGLGWKLRDGTPGFGLSVQGGGVAVLYLTVYAAYALYGIVPSLVAIVLMGVIAAGCGALALAQNAPGLAVLGVTGGFAAPVLAGTAEGNHVLLLAYYALLNLGVLGVAWAKGWRSVAVVGFVSTFVTGGLWGGLQYRPELYASVQPFVIVSFAIYLALAVRFALRSAQAEPPERSLAVDGALVFGLPAAMFALQAGLVEGVIPYGRAWSAAALAAVYLGGAGVLRRRVGVRLLADAFLAVGLTFATLALPLAFQRVVVGAMWVLEGAGLVWVGTRQRKAWMRWGGIALQLVAASVLFGEGVLSRGTFTAESLTGWIVAVGLAVSAYVLREPPGAAPGLPDAALGVPDAAPEAAHLGDSPGWLGRLANPARERAAGRLLLGFALFWWATTAAVHVLDLAPDRWTLAGMLAAAAASGALFLGAGRVLSWPALAAAALGVVPVGWALWLVATASETQPIVAGRGPGWVLLLGVAALALTSERTHRWRPAAFVGATWLAVAVAARSLGVSVGDATAGAWGTGAVGAVLAAGLALAVQTPPRMASASVRWRAVLGLGLAVGAWIAVSWHHPGASPPLPFVPVLNALGVPTVAGLAALAAARSAAPVRSRGWLTLDRGRARLWRADRRGGAHGLGNRRHRLERRRAVGLVGAPGRARGGVDGAGAAVCDARDAPPEPRAVVCRRGRAGARRRQAVPGGLVAGPGAGANRGLYHRRRDRAADRVPRAASARADGLGGARRRPSGFSGVGPRRYLAAPSW